MFAAPLIVSIGVRLGLGWRSVAVWSCAGLALSFGVPYFQADYDDGMLIVSEDMDMAIEWVNGRADGGGLVFDNWATAKFGAAMTGRSTIESSYSFFAYGHNFAVPRLYQASNRATYCILGWEDVAGVECNAREEITNRNLRYVLTDKHMYRSLTTTHAGRIDAAWEGFDALPYSRLVWQRGDVFVWELDGDLAQVGARSAH